MLFAADIGNTNISFGVFDADGALTLASRVEAARDKSADEYAVLFAQLLQLYGTDPKCITDAVLCSVVPSLTHTVTQALTRHFGVQPIELGPGVKTGLEIQIDLQTQLGSDLVANAVAARAFGQAPAVIADLGTATTLTVINGRGVLDGVIIAPGLRLGFDALAQYGAELPDISVAPPRRLIGKNTQDSMRSGILYGHAEMLDGLLRRIKEELGEEHPLLLATGGNAEAVLPYCREQFLYRPNLTLQGLNLIYQKNKH